jgi:hypothetical protein
MTVWIWVVMLRPIVICLVLVYFFLRGIALVYFIDNLWMISMDVVIHLMRCGLAIMFRCRGLSKVRCDVEG